MKVFLLMEKKDLEKDPMWFYFIHILAYNESKKYLALSKFELSFFMVLNITPFLQVLQSVLFGLQL